MNGPSNARRQTKSGAITEQLQVALDSALSGRVRVAIRQFKAASIRLASRRIHKAGYTRREDGQATILPEGLEAADVQPAPGDGLSVQ